MTSTGNAVVTVLANRLRSLAAVLVLTLALPATAAETYRMDVIVFLDLSVTGEAGGALTQPDVGRALALDNAAALSAAGITVLPDEQFGLQEQWQRLRNSKRYRPLIRLAWTQRDPPAERGPALRVRLGQAQVAGSADGFGAQAVSPVEGSVAMLLNRYLMLDSDLVYSVPVGGNYQSYTLRERRRMRRDELHYIDSPKLGMVARVTRASQE